MWAVDFGEKSQRNKIHVNKTCRYTLGCSERCLVNSVFYSIFFYHGFLGLILQLSSGVKLYEGYQKCLKALILMALFISSIHNFSNNVANCLC